MGDAIQVAYPFLIPLGTLEFIPLPLAVTLEGSFAYTNPISTGESFPFGRETNFLSVYVRINMYSVGHIIKMDQ